MLVDESHFMGKGKKGTSTGPTENVESKTLVHSAFDVARSLQVAKLIVQADELQDIRLVSKLRESEKVIWLTRHEAELPIVTSSNDAILHLPETTLTRMSQLKVGLLLAVMNSHVELDRLWSASPALPVPSGLTHS
jgi:pyruvate kinase